MSMASMPLIITEPPIFRPTLTQLNGQKHGLPMAINCKPMATDHLPQTAQSIVTIDSPPPIKEPLSEIMRKLELASAEVHNSRLIARNAFSKNDRLEFLEKTIEGHGADLANAVKGPNTIVSIPLKPARIRDRPKNLTRPGEIQVCSSQDILDLIIFYNNDFGILPEDSEILRREKLLDFLTRQPGRSSSRNS